MDANMSVTTPNNGINFSSTNVTDAVSSIGPNIDVHTLQVLTRLLSWYTGIELVISVLGIVFNLAVLIVIAHQKSFHNVTNYFIANLMMADIGLAVRYLVEGVMIVTKTIVFRCGGLADYLQYGLVQASCSTLMLLTFTRYDAILNPLTSINRWRGKRVAMAICFSWAVSFLLQIPVYYLDCWPTSPLSVVSHLYVYTIMFPLPASILLYCYARIVCRVVRGAFNRKQDTINSNATASKAQAGRVTQHRKLTRTVILILLAFFLLCGPRGTFVLYKFMVGWQVGNWLNDRIVLFTLMLLMELMTIVNPFIYAFTAPQFRGFLAAKILRSVPSREVSTIALRDSSI